MCAPCCMNPATPSTSRTQHLPYIQQLNITMEIAEVASMAMELLASPYLSDRHGGFYRGPDYAEDRSQHLRRIILFWPYMAMVDAFQHWVYTHAEGGDTGGVRR